jgi:hypothetical protein
MRSRRCSPVPRSGAGRPRRGAGPCVGRFPQPSRALDLKRAREPWFLSQPRRASSQPPGSPFRVAARHGAGTGLRPRRYGWHGSRWREPRANHTAACRHLDARQSVLHTFTRTRGGSGWQVGGGAAPGRRARNTCGPALEASSSAGARAARPGPLRARDGRRLVLRARWRGRVPWTSGERHAVPRRRAFRAAPRRQAAGGLLGLVRCRRCRRPRTPARR